MSCSPILASSPGDDKQKEISFGVSFLFGNCDAEGKLEPSDFYGSDVADGFTKLQESGVIASSIFEHVATSEI